MHENDPTTFGSQAAAAPRVAHVLFDSLAQQDAWRAAGIRLGDVEEVVHPGNRAALVRAVAELAARERTARLRLLLVGFDEQGRGEPFGRSSAPGFSSRAD